MKIVRGAYMGTECAAPPSLGRYQLRGSKAEVDAAYDAAVAIALGEVGAGAAPGEASVIVATHNRASVRAAAERMARLGIDRAHPGVSFAQIMGLADTLAHDVAAEGYNARALVVYGPFDDVFPWMLRRLEENSDALGGAAQERGRGMFAHAGI